MKTFATLLWAGAGGLGAVALFAMLLGAWGTAAVALLGTVAVASLANHVGRS
jgi:hypothetical protein